MDDKYVVMKVEDWAALLEPFRGTAHERLALESLLPGDFFVVRDQDVFAPAGLYAYSANIQSGLEFMDALGPSVLEEYERERLQALAHDIATLADKWQANRTNVKIPD